jgi:hypothetical protein
MDSELTTTELATTTVTARQKVLAILSVVCFWLLPVSPFLAMTAVSGTERTTGWPRNFAVSGAILCTVYTLLLGSWILFVYLRLPTPT